MICLSLWQPWASLWCSHAKTHETREWAWKHRGWVAVHATKKIVHHLDPTLDDICDSEFGGHWGTELPRGAIIGIVDVVDCVPAESVFAPGTAPEADDFYCGNFTPGRFAFKRCEFRKLREPVPWKGKQGPFQIPDELVREALAA